MGAFMGKAMDENLKKNQEFMLASQRAQMERQMMMQNAMMEQQMAISLARGRDMFQWWAAFYSIATVGILAGFKKSRNPALIAPLLPLTFIVGYFGDMAYGTKMTRIKAEARSILSTEPHLIGLPQPFPTQDDLDRRRETHWKTD